MCIWKHGYIYSQRITDQPNEKNIYRKLISFANWFFVPSARLTQTKTMLLHELTDSVCVWVLNWECSAYEMQRQINRFKHSHVHCGAFFFSSSLLVAFVITFKTPNIWTYNNYNVDCKCGRKRVKNEREMKRCSRHRQYFIQLAISNKSFYKHFAKMDIDVIQMINHRHKIMHRMNSQPHAIQLNLFMLLLLWVLVFRKSYTLEKVERGEKESDWVYILVELLVSLNSINDIISKWNGMFVIRATIWNMPFECLYDLIRFSLLLSLHSCECIFNSHWFAMHIAVFFLSCVYLLSIGHFAQIIIHHEPQTNDTTPFGFKNRQIDDDRRVQICIG